MKNSCIFLLALMALMTNAHAAESQTQQLETAVSGLWQAMSHAPGVAADIAALQPLFHPDAVVAGARPGGALNQQSGRAFLQSLQQVSAKGFYECEIGREVRLYGQFATVLSLVESRPDPTQKQADVTGINSLQWYHNGEKWQLLSLYYYLEQKPGELKQWPLAPGARRASAGTCL
ncbi:nuclear transport factor 2 family protein [Rheinheimera sp.]|uniref:nuclear transport factor 2 family protein n=1 Tax=Rheinheimera sp. TaxID=1869214 RepID=UPI003D29BD04